MAGLINAGPPDMTDQYNTQLSPDEEPAYQQWKASLPENLQNENNYDLRGAFKANAEKSANDHLPDDFKKPNHPTFSTQSKYHGVDGYEGGEWQSNGDDRWTFKASPTNVQMHGRAGLQSYFGRVEPGNMLSLPEQK